MHINALSLALSQRDNYKYLAFFAIAVGTFTSVADHGSVGVALPSIADYFLTDLPTTQWVLIGYALTISALLMPMGRLSDMVGRKRIYLLGFAIFVVGAIFAGSASSIINLIMSKVLMGVGAAMTQGTGMAMILSTFPSEERGKALGLQMSIVGTGGVAGPALGGLLINLMGWRWVFYGAAVLGTLAIIAAFMVLEGRRYSHRDGRRAGFDWLGAGLSTTALVLFLLGVSNGPRLGWATPQSAGALAGFAAFIAVFVAWELRASNPMLDVRYFRRKMFSLGVSASFISFIGMSSVRFLMPFYLQAVKGYTPGQVGLIIVPSALMMIIMGPTSGRLSDRFGWRTFTVGGLTLSVIGLLILSTLHVDSPLALVLAGMVLQSAGTGTFNAPNNSSVLSTVEHSRYGVMSGFLNLVRNSANVTGIAVATALVTAVMFSMGYPPTLAAVDSGGDGGILEAFASGLQVAYKIIAGVVVVGILLSLVKGDRPKQAKPEQETGTRSATAA